MNAPIHMRVEVFVDCLDGPACGHQARGRLTDDEAAVTCGACLKLLGYAAAPETMLTEVTHDVAPDTGNQRIAA